MTVETGSGSTRSHCVKNSLWMKLWTSRKTNRMMMTMMMIETRLRVGRRGVRIPEGLRDFLPSSEVSTSPLGNTQLPNQWASGVLPRRQSGRGVNFTTQTPPHIQVEKKQFPVYALFALTSTTSPSLL